MARGFRKGVRKQLGLKPAPQQNAAKDMYSNLAANTGFGTSSSVNGGFYVPFRISLDYQTLLNMYRGSWIVRSIIDTIPEDMLKDFPTLITEQLDDEVDEFKQVVSDTRTLQKVIEGLKWGRLFGGTVGIIILKGELDLMKPLAIEDVMPDTYRGLIIVDRWSGVDPGAELISDLDNPAEYGLPVYYQVTTDVGQYFKVHHSRVLRFTGRDLPLFEKQIQTYWGMSELEAVLEDLKRRDFTESGIADLISRANVLVMQNDMLNQMLSGVGLTQQQVTDYFTRMQAVSQSISTNGILALGKDEELFSHSYSFGGLSDIQVNAMMNISGACGIPMSRLFGRTASGLGQSGEGDLQLYYDSIDQKRTREMRPIFNKLIPIICMSVWGEVPDDLEYHFPPIRTVSAKDKADLGEQQLKPIFEAFTAGLIGRKTALMELQQMSGDNGLFTNVTDEMIEAASDDIQVMGDIASAEHESDLAQMGNDEGGGDK